MYLLAAHNRSAMTVTAPPIEDLVGRLELAFRLLGKRVYRPSLRTLRASHDVDKASFPLLAFLEEHGQSRPSDAANALELDLSTVSRQVRHLELSGLLDRRPDDVDGRACRIGLTPAGRAGLDAVRTTRNDLLDAVLVGWSEQDRTDLLRLLDRLLDGVRDSMPAHPNPEN
jgi:DNA-binding MarR family transcriptional regulator